MLGAVVDFFFPPHCPVCQAYVERRGDWCEACLAQTLQPRRLQMEASQQGFIDTAWSLTSYRGGTRDLIAELKFNGRKSTLPAFRTLITAALQVAAIRELILEQELLVPIPLHPQKQAARGFNQVELIFAAALQAVGRELTSLLQRDRMSASMYALTPAQRRENLADIFSVRAGFSLQGRSILLLDDIFTTGTTMLEAAKTLKAAGAAQVQALVLASDH